MIASPDLLTRVRNHRFGHTALAAAMMAILVLGVTRMNAPATGHSRHRPDPPSGRTTPLRAVVAPTYTSTDSLQASMSGHTLRIPRFYLQSDPDFAGPALRGGGVRPLRGFVIRLRLADFEPVRTPADEQAWSDAVSGSGSLYETFTSVGIDADATISASSLQWTLAAIEADTEAAGAFQVQSDRIAGLAHATAERHEDFVTDEVFYDDAGWKAVIGCHQTRQDDASAPPLSACELHFPLPELGAMAVADITKKDVDRWQEIEAAVTRITHAFANGA